MPNTLFTNTSFPPLLPSRHVPVLHLGRMQLGHLVAQLSEMGKQEKIQHENDDATRLVADTGGIPLSSPPSLRAPRTMLTMA